MSDYTKTTNFTAKDSTNDIILGAEFDTEFDAIVTSAATKANKVSSATANHIATLSASGDLQDSGVSSIVLSAQVAQNTSNIATNTSATAAAQADADTANSDLATLTANITAGQYGGTSLGTAASVGTSTSVTHALTGTVDEIVVTTYGVSGNGHAGFLQIGTGGSLLAAGYSGVYTSAGPTTSPAASAMPSTGAPAFTDSAYSAAKAYGRYTFRRVNGNTWQINFMVYLVSTTSDDLLYTGSGIVSLSGAVDIVGISVPSGLLDAGYWVVDYKRSA